jgi:hypothetical protein
VKARVAACWVILIRRELAPSPKPWSTTGAFTGSAFDAPARAIAAVQPAAHRHYREKWLSQFTATPM